jgi:hypothetical protein
VTIPWQLRANRVSVVAVAGLVAIAVYFGVLTWAVGNLDYEDWMLLVLVPVLVATAIPIIFAVTRRDEVPLTRLLVVALVVKLAASFLRYFIAVELYGSGDALRYDAAGSAIADAFHRGELTVLDVLSLGRITAFVDDFTGLVYTVMGPSRLGGFLVFSWLGYWGLFLFHRAARVGLPEGDQRRYALLVCFLPSLVFWPSSIGKEALMLFALGVSALGVARVLERRAFGWLILAGGLGLSYMIRPHVGVVVIGALAVAYLFRRRPGRAPVLGPVGRFVTVALLVGAMAFGLGQVVDELLPATAEQPTDVVSGVGEILDRAEQGTDEGGSEIDRPSPNNPLEYPGAVFSVLFRPTLFEVQSAGTAIAAMETAVLLVLLIVGRRRVRTSLRLAFRRPYILFCLVYTGIFTFAWSAFSNLGALARQRVQVWPLVLILLAAPVVSSRSSTPRPPALDRAWLPAES